MPESYFRVLIYFTRRWFFRCAGGMGCTYTNQYCNVVWREVLTYCYNSYTMESNKPIGWYLKEADKRITAFLEDEFSDLSISRYQWMIMQRIATAGSIDTWQYFQELKAHITVQQYGEIIQSMTERGWISVSGEDQRVFTAAGEEAYQQIGQLLQERNARMLHGISEEEYKLMLSVLNRIIENMSQ